MIMTWKKSVYFRENMDLTYGRGYVYSLQYHIVWCTKYRRCVLKDGIDEDCKSLLKDLADRYSLRKRRQSDIRRYNYGFCSGTSCKYCRYGDW